MLLAAILVACASPGPSASPDQAPDELDLGNTSVYGRLLSNLPADGKVDLQRALSAFSVAISPLPGVAAPPGGPTPEFMRADGSFAFRWINQHIDELTPEQQAIVDGFRQANPGAVKRRSGVLAPRWMHAGFVAQDDQQQFIDTLWSALEEARAFFSSHLRRDLHVDYTLTIRDLRGEEELSAAFTEFVRRQDGDAECSVTTDPRAEHLGKPQLRVIMAHEMFHCFQLDLTRNVVSDWIIEGGAEWAGEASLGPSADGAKEWSRYLLSPGGSLFGRSYDAVGFYEHLARRGFDVWGVMDKMLLAKGNERAFIDAGANSDDFLDTWASGLFRDGSLPAPDWNEEGRWATDAHATANERPITNGDAESKALAAVTNLDMVVASSADLLKVEMTGHSRVRSGTTEWIDTESLLLCTKSDRCACPPSLHYDGPFFEVATEPTVRLAITGGLEGGSWSLEGIALDGFCKPDQGPPGGGGGIGPIGGPDPCDEGCGESVGDTHLTTIDGGRYDFQAGGEYTMLRSADGKIEIQARLRRYADSDQVSVESALAFLVNGHRVSVYETTIGGVSGAITLHVDGAEVPLTSGIDLGNGGQVATMSKGIEVAWPDGTLAWVLTIGAGELGIDLQVAPSAVLRSSATGLLAPIAAGSDLPALADGSTLPGATEHDTRFDQVYHRLGPSWHVTDATSLFDYAAGESTATFDIAGFPSADVPLTVEESQLGATADQVAAATDACAGIAGDEREQLRCIFDFLVTQDPAWAAFYELLLKFLDKGPEVLQGEQPLPAGIVKLADVDTTANSMVVLPDGSLAAAVSHADLSAELVRINSTTGRIETSISVAAAVPVGFAAGSIWLSTGAGLTCAIDRVDPATLSKQGSVTVPCGDFGPSLVTTAAAAWASNGTAIARIDPTSMSLDPPVAIPVANARLLAGSAAVFAGGIEEGAHWFKLDDKGSAFADLGEIPDVTAAAGDALWADELAGAGRHRAAGGPDLTIPIDGLLVAADEGAIYVARDAVGSGRSELWRYPVNGGQPSMVLQNDVELPAVIGTAGLHYVDTTVFSGGQRLVAVWLTRSGLDQPSVMYLQSAAIP